jgi:hypothetical protein
MPAALIAGERDPKLLAQMARAEMRGKITALQEAFTGPSSGHVTYTAGDDRTLPGGRKTITRIHAVDRGSVVDRRTGR